MRRDKLEIISGVINDMGEIPKEGISIGNIRTYVVVCYPTTLKFLALGYLAFYLQ